MTQEERDLKAAERFWVNRGHRKDRPTPAEVAWRFRQFGSQTGGPQVRRPLSVEQSPVFRPELVSA